MSVLEYAFKFMELSSFAPAFIANKELKLNRFEAGLNLNLKVRCQCINVFPMRICMTPL